MRFSIYFLFTFFTFYQLSFLQVYAFMSKDDVGTTSGQFLKLGAGARATAMGEAFTGISNDATAIYWNPAGLNKLVQKEISAMHGMWFEEIFYNNLFYVHPTEIGNFGAGIQYVNYGTLKGADEYGNPTSDFKPVDMAFTVSYGRKISNILLGASIKYISSKIKEPASAFAVDLGVMKPLMNDKLSVGLAVKNIGTGLKYISKADPLPMNIKIGAGYKVIDNLTAAVDINLPSDNEIIIAVGGEYNYKISEDIVCSGRLGYNTISKNVTGLKGISAGIGGKYKNFLLDYAFVPFGDLGITHRVSLGIKFGKE